MMPLETAKLKVKPATLSICRALRGTIRISFAARHQPEIIGYALQDNRAFHSY